MFLQGHTIYKVEKRMTRESQDAARTMVLDEVPDYFNELSDYLEVLSNSQRLKILKMLEKKPRDVRTIASEISTSYENTKKHLDKLMGMGLIRKEVGLGQQTSKGVHPVWKYSLVPGAMEAVVRNLGIFSNMRIRMADADLKRRLDEVRHAIEGDITGHHPMLILLGGPEDGKCFLVPDDGVRIGRVDPTKPGPSDCEGDVILAREYTSVSRVSKPHAVFRKEGTKWLIEDRGSTGGTFLNSTPLQKRVPVEVCDGDLIELAKGTSGARLLVILPGRK
ncbi:MAG: FHA domain protein [Methanoregulaceae archaeon PtaB.Bin009]|nr:MAG: FHA domain protein [Methanoregulaceae archaeon PtaB.Bin009]